MKALVLSDIHGNIDALLSVAASVQHEEHTFDAVIVLGDLVDYGASPAEVITWVRQHATHVVRGNHDHAMGTGDDCRSAPQYHDLAVATRNYFRNHLSAADLDYLATLPMYLRWSASREQEIELVHASPEDPLFGYIPLDAPDARWRQALAPAAGATCVLVGHTHDQFMRQVDGITLVNPGSVGLPKDSDPRAAFAVLEDGRSDLRRAPYDVERAANRVQALPLPKAQRDRLAGLIRYASLPTP